MILGLGDILRDVLTKMDPRDMSKIDDTLQEIQDCNTTASLAVSIACARAGIHFFFHIYE